MATTDYSNADLRSSQQTSSEFIGWSIGQTTHPIKCVAGVGFTVSADAGVAGCCPASRRADDGSCRIQTACDGDNVVWDDGSTGTCRSDLTCRTMDLYDEFVPGSLPESSLRVALCLNTTRNQRTLYARVGADETGASTTSDLLTSTPSSEIPEPTESGDPPADQDTPSPNQAWIAGAVVGPVLLIALIVLGIWWYKRRSKAKAAAAGPAQTSPGQENKHYSAQAPGMQGYPPQQPYYYDPNQQHQQHQSWGPATGYQQQQPSQYQHQQGVHFMPELSGQQHPTSPTELPAGSGR